MQFAYALLPIDTLSLLNEQYRVLLNNLHTDIIDFQILVMVLSYICDKS